jgi:hypothetical protein
VSQTRIPHLRNYLYEGATIWLDRKQAKFTEACSG